MWCAAAKLKTEKEAEIRLYLQSKAAAGASISCRKPSHPPASFTNGVRHIMTRCTVGAYSPQFRR
jgi:hypothetical protein